MLNLHVLLTNESSESQVNEKEPLNYENFEAIMTMLIDFDDEIEFPVGAIITLPENTFNAAATATSVSDVEIGVSENSLIPPISIILILTFLRTVESHMKVKIQMIAQLVSYNKTGLHSIHILTFLNCSADSTNTRIFFTDIHKNIGLFANTFDDNFSEGALGFEHNDSAENSSIGASASNKIKKLVEKIRRNIRQLGIYMKVHDHEKLLNVLVMAQQLNIISPMSNSQ